ncbi:MAG: 50S ribosomal protein L11 methyltransferase [Armatimonadetes bacterium]|nr:50S ribosomal protein L11 methyltransferase [Armatimonadota bacterium]
MNGTVWIEVRATFPEAPEDWSPLADAFDRHGCPGSLIGERPPSISGYLVDVPAARAKVEELRAELLRLGAASVETQEVPEEDWAESWRKFFKPRRIGKRFVIRPTWEEFEAGPDDLEIVLDPGQAFGTGDHPTTRLCLELMEEAFEARRPDSVLDLGCGSGILSIGASLLGARDVLGVDIEAVSVEVARQNAELNGVQVEFLCADGFADAKLHGPFDLVVSNIISATLIRLAPKVAQRQASGGVWIVSGIIRQNWEDVQKAAARAGYELKSERFEDDWVAAALVRCGP